MSEVEKLSFDDIQIDQFIIRFKGYNGFTSYYEWTVEIDDLPLLECSTPEKSFENICAFHAGKDFDWGYWYDEDREYLFELMEMIKPRLAPEGFTED